MSKGKKSKKGKGKKQYLTSEQITEQIIARIISGSNLLLDRKEN